jgi:hypothetical protein
MRQWGAALGEDPARRLHYDGTGTPPRPPLPQHRTAFANTPPGGFDGRIHPPHWSAQRDGQQLRGFSYSGTPSMNPYTYTPNSFMTPPYTTSAEWATQQSTPTPSWDGQSSSLVPYDPSTEDARLHQAFALGTAAGNTLMQRDNGSYYSSIGEAGQARRLTLQRFLLHYPLLSRSEYSRMTHQFTFINPFGTPEPFHTKQFRSTRNSSPGVWKEQ